MKNAITLPAQGFGSQLPREGFLRIDAGQKGYSDPGIDYSKTHRHADFPLKDRWVVNLVANYKSELKTPLTFSLTLVKPQSGLSKHDKKAFPCQESNFTDETNQHDDN